MFGKNNIWKENEMKKALLLGFGMAFLLSGCGQVEVQETPIVQQNVRAAEPSQEEMNEAEWIKKSMEAYQERHERESEKMLYGDDMSLTIEQTLFGGDLEGSPMPEEDLEEELYYDSLEELANCVMAEAGNQGIDGMRMVTDVILNRVDDPDFPDNIHDVISQPFHFSSYWDGGMEKWSIPSEECYKAVQMELENRSYPGLYYFQAGWYSEHGSPAFRYGDHYFSTK